MLILTAEEVRKALPMNEAIEAMKKAFASLSNGTAVVPLRTRLPIPNSDALSLFMPAYVHAEDGRALAIKAASLFPTNPARGLAYIQAAVLVFDPETGRAQALLEGSSLTATRTGAAGGAAIDLLSRADSKVAAIFGAGAQGRTQLEAACTARNIETVHIFDSDRNKAEEFAEEMKGKGPIPTDIRVASSAKEAVENADIICTATTSTQPVFDDKNLKPGTHISAVGAYTPEMQEIPAETVRRAKVVVDSRSASLEEAGDLIQPMRAGLFDESHIHAELGEIVLGRKTGRATEEEITYFKSVGIAVQDAMAAKTALENARKMNIGTEVEF
ncbi:MAG: ornithine cyclodeaminase [Anaerolineales bacterium]|nr:ornithine cyclodeaminase family protein [Anaerolineae bacterium]PWB75754.1 MAG: ornithine cyclodeaminase [Anaerolineales bacterium]